ncbi:MAG: hypothetical protein ACOCZ5_03425 [bacterium]
MDNFLLYLQDELQLGSVEEFENEEGNTIYVSNDCIVTYKDDLIILDLDINLYPTDAAMLALGLDEWSKNNNIELRIGEVFSFDEDFNVYFGHEAIKQSENDLSSVINEKAENISEMDQILMFSDGYFYC